MIVCLRCGESKPPELFHLDKRRPNGRRPRCMVCIRAENSARNAVRPLEQRAREAERQREYRRLKRDQISRARSTPERRDARKSLRLSKEYGITLADYRRMAQSQGDLCLICGRPETVPDPRTGLIRELAVDHCHETGVVRGLLCSRCNTAIGLLDDDPQRLVSAADYLRLSAAGVAARARRAS